MGLIECVAFGGIFVMFLVGVWVAVGALEWPTQPPKPTYAATDKVLVFDDTGDTIVVDVIWCGECAMIPYILGSNNIRLKVDGGTGNMLRLENDGTVRSRHPMQWRPIDDSN